MALPAFRVAANALAQHLQVTAGTAVRLVSEADFALPAVDAMLLERYTLVRQLHGWSHEEGLQEVEQLGTHLATAANHLLAGKKTFWVSPELAQALRQTNLDIPGDVLALPFAACAFAFNDTPTLQLAQGLIDQYASPRAPYRTLTVYVYPSREEVSPGFEFVFLADAYDGEWPYMINRSVLTDGKRNLDEILDSHPDDSSDEMFFAPAMGELLKLVTNAVLYTTSASYRQERRGAAPRGLTPKHGTLSGEEVYYLPGRIRIGATKEAERRSAGSGTAVHTRFWVRGHWRRPNPAWQEQRVRWIEPYLKGPDAAAVIERAYELTAGLSARQAV